MKRPQLYLFLALFGALTHTAQAQSLPPLSAAQGLDADVSVTTDSVRMMFRPAEWPHVVWTAAPGAAWDWHDRAVLAFDATNPGPTPVDFAVRIDDDPGADGVHHCRTAQGTLGPHSSGSFCIEMAADDPMTHGMRGCPPLPGEVGQQTLFAQGEINPAHIVAFQIFMHHPPTPQTLRVSRLRLLPTGAPGDRYTGIVDQWGQFTRADWPGKVHADADLQTRRAAEAKTLAATPTLPGRDAYGGWAAGPTLPASGFFATTKRDGRWWLVTPTGHLFLSFGVDGINTWNDTVVESRESMFTNLPQPGEPLARHFWRADHVLYGPYKAGKTFNFYEANLERTFGPDYIPAWGIRTLARLRSWGFNTIGNWSDERLEAAHQVPYTATLEVGGPHARLASGSDYWGQMHDPFDPQFAADCDASFHDKATRLRDDPWCLGWFVDNELSWSGGPVENGRWGLAYGALAAPAGQPAKGAFVAQLRAKYVTVAHFNTAWGASLTRWEDLDAPFQASQTPTDAQKQDMSDFVYAFARRYFSTVRETLRKYDPHHLYLGCRFMGGANTDAVRAAGEVCDVVSFNVYLPRLDRSKLQDTWGLPPNFDRPSLIGEFHFGATDRGLFHPGLVRAASQSERAAMFRRYMESVVDDPLFVGAHWFEYADEPLAGRSLDGENYNVGFVSVTDTPYPEMVRAARGIFTDAYARRAAKHP